MNNAKSYQQTGEEGIAQGTGPESEMQYNYMSSKKKDHTQEEG